ncbi:MAG: hypothetical protein GEU88_18480 [Solirubrobacterales bacterium]|nr:hypothetical protein [Solirubrobacterales bacterium]
MVQEVAGIGGHRRHAGAVALCLLVIGAVALVAPANAARATAKPGAYKGKVFSREDGPNNKEWVKFKVVGKRMKAFTSRLWVICYAGGTTYLNLPVKFKAPPAKIKRGRADRRWRNPFRVDGEREVLKGRLKLRFKSRGKVGGKVRIEFGSCGTTTGDPPGYMAIRAKHRR